MIRWDDDHGVLVVGDRNWIGERGYWTDYEFPPETEQQPLHERQAFVKFESGWCVSVIWGDLTYSSNHDARHGYWDGTAAPEFTDTPELVEVGVLRRGFSLLGEPFGYVDADQLNLLLDRVQTLPSDATEEQVQDLLKAEPELDERPDVLTRLMHDEKGIL